MLSAAALGMAAYGVYSIGLGLCGMLGCVSLEVWADLGLIGLGLLLLLAAAFVRVRFPGGLPLAASAMLGLQALALHNDLHFFGRTVVAFQVARGVMAGALLLLAIAGSKTDREPPPPSAPARHMTRP